MLITMKLNGMKYRRNELTLSETGNTTNAVVEIRKLHFQSDTRPAQLTLRLSYK